MKEVDIRYGEYASKWSLTDWYEESEEALRELMESGEDFDTDWFGCAKEIHFAQIVRAGGKYTVRVSCHTDELYDSDDLIYDAIWEIKKSLDEVPDEVIDGIREEAHGCNLSDVATETRTLPGTASFDEITDTIGKLEIIAEMRTNEDFKRLCAIVKEHVENMKDSPVEDKPKLNKYFVTFAIDGRCSYSVTASSIEEAKEQAQIEFETDNFSGSFECIDAKVVTVEDEHGEIVYEY